MVPLTESELPVGKDVISFGVGECEDHVCYRDGRSTPPPGGSPDAPATGICTQSCTPATRCNGELVCRELVLDSATVAELCGAGMCDQLGGAFGSWFCAAAR